MIFQKSWPSIAGVYRQVWEKRLVSNLNLRNSHLRVRVYKLMASLEKIQLQLSSPDCYHCSEPCTSSMLRLTT